MDLREFQERVRREDAESGWDRLTTPQLLCHFAEEAGELVQAANHCLACAETTAEHRAAIAIELADSLWFLAKLANRFAVSLDDEATAQLGRAPSRAAAASAEALANGLRRVREEVEEGG
ncbi:MAG: hypothetical protein ACYC5O_17750 [Anaerolineae bacterium]